MKQKKVNEDLLFCDSKKNKTIAIKGKFLPSVSKISCSNRVVSIPVWIKIPCSDWYSYILLSVITVLAVTSIFVYVYNGKEQYYTDVDSRNVLLLEICEKIRLNNAISSNLSLGFITHLIFLSTDRLYVIHLAEKLQ